MPGLNQRGPMNEGPMTGWGRGNCAGAGDPGQGFARRNSMGMGRRRRQGQGGGWGNRATQQAASDPTQFAAGQTTLQDRTNMLEAEIAQLKQQLKDLSKPRD